MSVLEEHGDESRRWWIVAAVLVGLLLVVLGLAWGARLIQQRSIPDYARVEAIERRFEPQLRKLEEYARNFERRYEFGRPDSEPVKALFAHQAIVKATVWNLYTAPNRGGWGVKRGSMTVGVRCVLRRSARQPGDRVVNVWWGKGRQFVEYDAKVLDVAGIIRGYSMVLDVGKLGPQSDGLGNQPHNPRVQTDAAVEDADDAGARGENSVE